jgi:hypothetical protein
LLTDGETEDREKCIRLATSEARNPKTTIVNTFGIGQCDVHFVERVALNGDGTCVILRTDEVDQLRSKVVEVLSKTIQPSLKEFKTKFSIKQGLSPKVQSKAIKDTKEVFRNQLYSEFFIIDQKVYEEDSEINYEISYLDPYKAKQVTIKVSKSDFLEVTPGHSISKLASHYRLANYVDETK